ADREITLDSIYISPFRKNIIAVPKDIQTKLYRSERREKLFSPSEINQLSRYIMPYKNKYSSSAAYIVNRGRVLELSGQYYNNIIGPVAGSVDFYETEKYHLNFNH